MPATEARAARLCRRGWKLLAETAEVIWTLAKILVPLGLLVRVCDLLGWVDALGVALQPVMAAVGLPGAMGLVWATGMTSNLYAAMAVFVAVAPGAELTTAQVTMVCLMLLVSHALPVELRIAQQAGMRVGPLLALRVGGAFLMGGLLNLVYRTAGWLQTPNHAVWQPQVQSDSWGAWARAQGEALVGIFVIVLALLFLLKLLRRLQVTALLTRLLRPVLEALGISETATPLVIIGLTLGLTYGGGLLIREARSGRASAADVFSSLSLLSLCHSLVEDTLLMMALGAHLSGVLVFRFGVSALTIAALAAWFRHLPEVTRTRWLCAPPTSSDTVDQPPALPPSASESLNENYGVS